MRNMTGHKLVRFAHVNQHNFLRCGQSFELMNINFFDLGFGCGD
jgi:hypothetical protein